MVNGNYYISYLNKLYTINAQGKILNIYVSKYAINDFKVIKDKVILTSHNSIVVVNKLNKVISISPVELFDAQYILSSTGLCYCPSVDDRISEFSFDNNFSIITKTYAPLSNSKELKDIHLSYSDGSYLFAFPNNNRKLIYVLNKGFSQNTISKKIYLSDTDVTPNKSTILNEEGDPNFKIASTNGLNYVIVLIKGKIKILSFAL